MNELPKTMTEPQQDNTPIMSDALSPRRKKTNRNFWLIFSVATIVICCCSIICLILFVFGQGDNTNLASENEPVQPILDSYMKSMVLRDTESAYALFSPRAQKQFTISNLQELREGDSYMTFEGYQNLTVIQLRIYEIPETDPDSPQGIVATATGLITYEDGAQRDFKSVLEKVEGKWKIDNIYISLLPINQK